MPRKPLRSPRLNCARLALRLACCLGVGLVLAGCGSKGPLYLPTAPEAADRTPLHKLPGALLNDAPAP